MGNLKSKYNILIVEDNVGFIKPIISYFNKLGWKVKAITNEEDVEYLYNNPKSLDFKLYDCFILDHLLIFEFKTFIGVELFMRLTKENTLPPTMILSGNMNKPDSETYFKFGAKSCCQKPVASKTLSNYVKSTITGDFSDIGNQSQSMGFLYREDNKTEGKAIFHPTRETIDLDIYNREMALKSYFDDTVKENIDKYDHIENPVLFIARRWNSWYPSFFDVPGGAYVLMMPQFNNQNEMILIDPGFKSLKVLADQNISVANISTCITSHNHPDHIGGLFEYLACRNTLEKRTHLFCNATTLKMFFNHRSIQQIEDIELDVFENWDKKKFNKILISGFRTVHDEIGSKNKPLAITFSFFRPGNKYEKIVILGDTEYRADYIKKLANHNLKVLVLHIGSAQLKDGTGKHLYLNGTKKLLSGLDRELDEIKYNGKLLVLISEWGLEHTTKVHLEKICNKKLPNLKNNQPIQDVIDFLKNELEHINILPADIGLMIDIIDQKIYVKNIKNEKYKFDEIDYKIVNDKINYYKV